MNYLKYRNLGLRVVGALAIVLVIHTSSLAQAVISPKAAQSSNQDLIVSFDAKGTAVGWDFGAAQALAERLDLDRDLNLIFAGSSSGSLIATYYGCHGLTRETAIFARKKLKDWSDKKILNEHTKAKLIQLMLGEDTDSPYTNLQPIVDIVTKNGTCIPEYPLMLTAANMEILDQRSGSPLGTKGNKRVDLGNFDVYEDGRKIGKACTYFVTTQIADRLSAIKPEERLCDVRPIKTAQDLLLGVRASVSEPTYFAPIADSNPTSVQSVYGPITKRIYNGGFVFMSPVQDMKRVMPEAAVFGTGRGVFSRAQNRIVQSWFAFDMNRAQMESRFFFDTQMQFTAEEWKKMDEVSVAEQADLGYASALNCLKDSVACISKLYSRPAQDKSASGEALEPRTRRGIVGYLKPQ